MAKFDFNMDMDKFFPQGIQDENLALEMIDAGQEVMLKAIKSGAARHKRTGAMCSSLKKTKPMIDKNGDAVGRVKFYGKDKNGMENWYKALWIEYGTVHQNAQPFVRPAMKSCESAAGAAMRRVFDEKVKEEP